MSGPTIKFVPEISYNITLLRIPETADPTLTHNRTTVLMDIDYPEMAKFIASWPVGSVFEINATCIVE